jgi:hypothetical protein
MDRYWFESQAEVRFTMIGQNDYDEPMSLCFQEQHQ